MLVKISELTGMALDFAVALSANLKVGSLEGYPESFCVAKGHEIRGAIKGIPLNEVFKYGYYQPSSDWKTAGEIILQHKIAIVPRGDYWIAAHNDQQLLVDPYEGSNPLEAAMRCFVGKELPNEYKCGEGFDEIDVPHVLVAFKKPSIKLT